MKPLSSIFPFAACLLLAACGQSSSPPQRDIQAAFESELPGLLKLEEFSVENSRNTGSAEAPVWVARAVAKVSLREATYDIDTVEEGVRILKPVRAAGESFTTYGTVRSERSGDGWRHFFQNDGSSNPALGRPRSNYGPDALIAGSPEAKELLEKLAREKEAARLAEETRLAEEAAQRRKQEEAEAAKKQRIEAAVAKHGAGFAPHRMKDLTWEAGGKLALLVTGSSEGNGKVWGTNVYSTESDFAKSVVHSGLLKPGETGIVEATITPETKKDGFRGSPRNGVSSENSSGWYWGYSLRLLERIPNE